MKNVILVVMSHNLNQAQINGLNEMGLEPVLISDVNSDLANTCKQIDPNATKADIQQIADSVVKTAVSLGATALMIQGEPSLFFSAVENAKDRGLQCLIATSERVSVERVADDGTVTKTNVFKHVKFRQL
jgi:Ethanolamine utilization protein EutJ (predicted chaperonin)